MPQLDEVGGTDDTPSLTPLGCPACGKPVPIGASDIARCKACDREVQIPASYLALRAAARLDDEARARADAMIDELTRPPSRFMRFWMAAGFTSIVGSFVLVAAWLLVSIVMCIGTFVEAGPFGAAIMLLVGLVLGVPLLYNETLHELAVPLEADFADVWGGTGSYGLLGLSFYVLLAVPVIFAGYADAFESVRATLRKILSAPESTEGGAAQCRTCGAPFDVPQGAAHVRCIYCLADNLVHVSAAGIAKAAKDSTIVCEDLESAIREERSVAASGRVQVALRLAKWLLLVPLFVLFGRCVGAINEDDATFWQRAVSSAPMIPNNDENPPLARDRATLFDVHKTFDGCDDVDCWAYYFVALERGDELRITVEDGDLRLVGIARRHIDTWYNPTYGWTALDLDTPVPYAGWYRVTLATSKTIQGPEPRVVWDASH